jgi:peptidyl-Lys metalloendopeptidase
MNPTCIWKSLSATVLLTCSLGAHASSPISVTITPESENFGRNGAAVVNVTVTNTSASPLRVLKWELPFGDIEAPLFDIARYGQQARYLGMQAKRAAPAPADYLQLAPGASRSARVNLSSLYEMGVTGAYTVSYHPGTLHLLAANGAPRAAGELQSAPVSIWVDGQETFTPDP